MTTAAIGPGRAVMGTDVTKVYGAGDSAVPALRIKAVTRLSEHVAHDPQVRRVLEVAAGDDATPEVREAAQTLLRQRETP